MSLGEEDDDGKKQGLRTGTSSRGREHVREELALTTWTPEGGGPRIAGLERLGGRR